MSLSPKIRAHSDTLSFPPLQPLQGSCYKMLERLVTLCLLLKRIKRGRGKILVVCCSLPHFFFFFLFSFLDLITVNTQIYGLNVFFLKYRKCCGAQGGKERGKASGQVDTPNARLFTRVSSILSNTTCLLKKKITLYSFTFQKIKHEFGE